MGFEAMQDLAPSWGGWWCLCLPGVVNGNSASLTRIITLASIGIHLP